MSPRRRHVARRARTITAGLSAAAFLGLGGVMALASNGSAATAHTGISSTPQSTLPSNPSASSGNTFDDGTNQTYGNIDATGGDDGSGTTTYGNTGNGWNAQPSVVMPNLGSGQTSSRGS
jgi:hypothetical protein